MNHRPAKWRLPLAPVPLLFALTTCSILQPPAVDVTGVWVGSYSDINGTILGAVTFRLEQEGAEVTGEVGFVEDPPGSFNVGLEVEGVVRRSTLHLHFTTDDDYVLQCDVSGGLAASGTYESPFESLTWTASLLPTERLEAVEAFQLPEGAGRCLAYDGASYWCAYGDGITVLTPAGALVSSATLQEPRPTGDGIVNLSWDGARMVSVSKYIDELRLFSVDASGHWEILLRPAYDHQGDGLTFLDGSYWLAHHRGLAKIDSSGVVDATFDHPGIANSIASDGQSLVLLEFYPRVLLRLDPVNGGIAGAFVVGGMDPQSQRLVSLCYAGDALQAVRETFTEAGTELWLVSLEPR